MLVNKGSENLAKQNSNGLAQVFGDANLHLSIANIIQKHLCNGKDIREVALNVLDLSKKKNIIDLGCGFGFFTRGLIGKVHHNAKITGIDRHSRNKQLYLSACKYSGLKGSFTQMEYPEYIHLKIIHSILLFVVMHFTFFPSIFSKYLAF